MDKQQYVEFCRSIPEAAVDQPFNEDFDTYIARHVNSKKWFAAIMERDGRTFVNLKCDPIEAEFLRGVYAGIEPGYHMNKTHWNTVYFESDVSDELLRRLTYDSFRLTAHR